MSVTEILTDSIHKQFAANKRVNLFYENLDFRNHFLHETKEIIRKYKWDLLRIDDENQAENWIRLMTEKAVNTFCLNNQFMDMRESHTFELGALYKLLWKEIIDELKSESVNFDGIQKSHLSRLTNWLMQSNSFVKEINNSKEATTSEVVCSEYSAEFQLKLLNVNLDEIIEPVLDIGCGQSAHLVNFLRNKGIEAYGIERLIRRSTDYIFKADWLDYDFKPHYWGTVISNLSFALHFTNHHNRKDGDYILYARKYMEILNSLKPLGSFYYAPGLPYIEAYLPKEKYKATTQRINDDFSSTCVVSFMGTR